MFMIGLLEILNQGNELSDKINSILHHEKYTIQTPVKGRMKFKVLRLLGTWVLKCSRWWRAGSQLHVFSSQPASLSLVFYYSWRDIMHISGYIPAVTSGFIQKTTNPMEPPFGHSLGSACTLQCVLP